MAEMMANVKRAQELVKVEGAKVQEELAAYGPLVAARCIKQCACCEPACAQRLGLSLTLLEAGPAGQNSRGFQKTKL